MALEAEQVAGSKAKQDGRKIWAYRAEQMRKLIEVNAAGHTVVLIPGLALPLFGSPSRIIMGIPIIGEICVGMLMPIDMHTNLVSLGALAATANGLGSVGYKVTAESLKHYIYFIENTIREVDSGLVHDKMKWVLHLTLCVFELLDKWGIVSENATKLRLLLEKCVKSTSERAKSSPPSVGALSGRIQELLNFANHRIVSIMEADDGLTNQPAVDAIMNDAADAQGKTLDEMLLFEYKQLKSLLQEIESLVVATISKVAQWESGSDECYSQLMKVISQTIGTDHRRFLYQRDDTTPDAQVVISGLEKLIRGNMFDSGRTPQGIAFLSQMRDTGAGGPDLKRNCPN